MEVPEEAARALREEEVRGQPHLLRDVRHEPHGAVGHHAAHRRPAAAALLCVESPEEVPVVGRARAARGLGEPPDVLRGVEGVGGWEPVGDRLEAEAAVVVVGGGTEGGGPVGAEEAPAVVLRVDQGDVDDAARGVEEGAGEGRERGHVALRRVWDRSTCGGTLRACSVRCSLLGTEEGRKC